MMMSRHVAVAALILILTMVGLGLLAIPRIYCTGVMNGWYANEHHRTDITLEADQWETELKMCYDNPYLTNWRDEAEAEAARA